MTIFYLYPPWNWVMNRYRSYCLLIEIGMENNQDLFEKISSAGQGHLLDHFHQIKDEGVRQQFLAQLISIDYPLINKLFNDVYKAEPKIESANSYSPMTDVIELEEIEKNKKDLEEIGLKAIRDGEVAVLLMSGGQGTRLGFDHPKGMFRIGLQSKMCLFEFFTKRLQSLNKLAQTTIPITWYIMTSEINNEEIISYFSDNNHFGYSPDHIKFFAQGALPALDFNGKIIIEKEDGISLAPGGNGALYYQLVKHRMLDDMMKRKIKYINVGAVDNILLKLGDPVALGYMIKNNRDIVSKVATKRDWQEKVGCHLLDHGEPRVMEYSQMSQQLKKAVDEQGKLKYRHSFLAIYLVTVDFIYQITHNQEAMAKFNSNYHIAKKKIPIYNQQTKQTIKPEKETGIKFELFCFDCFNLSKGFGVFEIDRNQEFAPVKNASGDDSPETARMAISKQHAKWLKNSGMSFEGQPDANHKLCEVDISLTYDGEGLEDLVNQFKSQQSLPFYLRAVKGSL